MGTKDEEFTTADYIFPGTVFDTKIERGNQFEAQLLKVRSIIEKQVRWEVGEELCCLIGNKMLENMEAGKLLGSQLEQYMKHYLKGEGIEDGS